MHAATKILLLALVVTGASACRNQESPDQNAVITNTVPEGADVEALPADESSATSTNELVNGAADPDLNGDVTAPDNQTDSY